MSDEQRQWMLTISLALFGIFAILIAIMVKIPPCH